ncbi:hypothetical protein [Streptomyces lavendulocolor]|uniref:hypothetical protein n=1 Tax=Streptomyces lavendulocolor TaxID=67316 RepID=UPI00167BC531|nr:hypothetical protein GCM10018771_19590 [Streptomyces cellulosae]
MPRRTVVIRRLFGVLVALLLVGCVSGALSSPSAAVAVVAEHSDRDHAEGFAFSSLSAHGAADMSGHSCASDDDHCPDLRVEQVPHIPTPVLGAAPLLLPLLAAARSRGGRQWNPAKSPGSYQLSVIRT